MDKAAFIKDRGRRYMAQTLNEYEQKVEGFVPKKESEAFKAFVRRKFGALAGEMKQVAELENTELNGAAQDLIDRVYPDERPTRSGAKT